MIVKSRMDCEVDRLRRRNLSGPDIARCRGRRGVGKRDALSSPQRVLRYTRYRRMNDE